MSDFYVGSSSGTCTVARRYVENLEQIHICITSFQIVTVFFVIVTIKLLARPTELATPLTNLSCNT